MHGDLRVVGARLDAQVAARGIRIEVVAEERRQPLERGRALRGDAVAIDAVELEQRRAEAERDRQVARGKPQRLAGVVRRRLGRAADRAGRADLEPLGHAGGRVRPVLQQRHEVVAVGARHHVERGEVQVVLDGRRDARLVRRRRTRGRMPRPRPARAPDGHADRGAGARADARARPRRRRGEPEQAPPADAARGLR